MNLNNNEINQMDINNNEINQMDINIQNTVEDVSYKTIKRKPKRFLLERLETLNTVLGIIGINDENKIFYSHIISGNIEMQLQIINLIPNIKKYYATSGWATFKTAIDVENKSLSIIRALLREHNIEYTSKAIKVKVGVKMVSSTMYEIQNH
jgi:hypothetical protein